MIGQTGQMLIVAGDVYIASLYSTQTVAAIGVASGIINPIFWLGMGLMSGVSAFMAKRRGEGERDETMLFSLLLYALVVGLILALLLESMVPVINFLGIEKALLPELKQYIKIVAWSLPFAFIFQVTREFLQAYEKVVVPNLIMASSVLFNLALNYILVFGTPYTQALGSVGLAYASVGMRVFLALAIVLFSYSYIHVGKVHLSFVKKIFKFSLPMGFMFILEVGAFALVSIFSGQLGTLAAAVNNIILTIASITFMIPYGLANGVGVKVGHAFGQGEKAKIVAYTKTALKMIGLYIVLMTSMYFLAGRPLMQFISHDDKVIELGASLLIIVGLFQLADSLQVLLSGLLRGLQDTMGPFITIVSALWLVGLPTGYYLSFIQELGAMGLWIGLALALYMAAGTLSWITLAKFKRLNLTI